MANRNETLKKRYQVYKRLGYDSKTSRALSQRSLDVSNIELSDKTGKLKRNSATKKYIEKDMISWKRSQVINNYNEEIKSIDNDTVYTSHGMLTHDKRYKGKNGKIISIIKNENNISRDQAYYFFYLMTQGGMTYEQTKLQQLTNKEFEEYDARKKMRNQFKKEKRGMPIKRNRNLPRVKTANQKY